MEYCSSIYNTIVKYNNSTYVYNSLTGGLGKLDNEKTAQYLESDNISNIDETTLATLVANKFVINPKVNEKANVRYKIITSKVAKRKLSVSICPTYMCNLACTYCFENTWENKIHIMNSEEWQTLQSHLEAQVSSEKYDVVRVTWSGGEPLIAEKNIIKVNHALNKMASRANIKYFSSMATNTILATTDTFAELVSSGIDSIQITLDGSEDLHNARRTNKEKKKTYGQTIHNIKILREMTEKVNVLVRIHLSRSNIESIEDAIGDLENAGLRNKVGIGFSKLQGVEDSLSDSDYAEIEVLMYRMLKNRKWSIKNTLLRKLKPQTIGCATYTMNSYSIGPDLRVYKCWELGFDSNCSYGRIDSSGAIQSNGVEDIAHAYDPFDLEKCRNCMQLPLCMGGCAKAAIGSGDTTEIVDERQILCHSIKYNMEEMVKLFLESSEEGNEQ